MKRQINKKWMNPFRIRKGDFVILILPSLLWAGAIYSRPYIIHPFCGTQASICTKASIPFIDQLSLGIEDGQADFYSYVTQNLSGIYALTAPLGWNTALFILGSMSRTAALSAMAVETMIVVQTLSWNGLFTEISHLVSQRPRPFVYSDPSQRGIDSAHYISFYSGHTSSSAAATLCIFLLLISRCAPLILIVFSFGIFEILVFSTAYFRIFAGRHFLTDVICGALAGSLVAGVIVFYHRRRTRGLIFAVFQGTKELTYR